MTITSATIIVEEAGNMLKIVHINGQLDESNVDEKIQEIYKSLESSPKGTNLLFDLENLEYMNSKSIGYLTDIYGKVTENGGKIAIAKAKPNILDILQVVGLTQLIQAFDSTEEAKNSLIPTASAPAQPSAPAPAPAVPITASPEPEIQVQPVVTEQTNPQPQTQTPQVAEPTQAPAATQPAAQVPPVEPISTPEASNQSTESGVYKFEQ